MENKDKIAALDEIILLLCTEVSLLREENALLLACLDRESDNDSHPTKNATPVRSKPSGYVEGIDAAFPLCRGNAVAEAGAERIDDPLIFAAISAANDVLAYARDCEFSEEMRTYHVNDGRFAAAEEFYDAACRASEAWESCRHIRILHDGRPDTSVGCRKISRALRLDGIANRARVKYIKLLMGV